MTTNGGMLIKAFDSNGKPATDAAIHVSVWTEDPFKANQDYKCNADGQVEIKLPKTLTLLRIWARSEGQVPLFAEWWPELQDSGAPIPEEFAFRLAEGSVIGGVVKNEEGEPIAGASVAVKNDVKKNRHSEERPTESDWLASGDAACITDAQGRWSLDNVPRDKATQVRLKISHPGYIDDLDWGEMQQAQHVTMDALRAGAATIVMQRGVKIRGTVLDAKDRPVAGAVVIWGDQPYLQEGSQETRTDEEGRFQSAALPKGPTTVTAVAPGWAPALKKIDVSPETPSADFHLRPGKQLRLRIVNRDGKPLAGAYITIIGWRGGASLYNEKHPRVMDAKIPWKADDNGVFEWTWAPDDAVTYRVWKRGYKYADFELTATGAEQKIVMPQP